MHNGRNKQEYHSTQIHVQNQRGRLPLCRQIGPDIELVSAESFKDVPVMQQCGRCRRFLGIERYPGEHRISLSPNQRRLIKAIRERTETPGQWIPAAELCENKSSSARSSLHRSLRRLRSRDYLEMRTMKGRAEVRLASRTNPG